MDSRFPSLMRFSDYRAASTNARVCVREIERRTGTNAIINVDGDRVIFRYGDNLGGPFARSLREIDRWNGGDVDAAVHVIQYAKNATRDEKDKVVEQQKKDDRAEQQNLMDKTCEDARPDAVDHAAFLSRKRRGTTKNISVGPA